MIVVALPGRLIFLISPAVFFGIRAFLLSVTAFFCPLAVFFCRNCSGVI